MRDFNQYMAYFVLFILLLAGIVRTFRCLSPDSHILKIAYLTWTIGCVGGPVAALVTRDASNVTYGMVAVVLGSIIAIIAAIRGERFSLQ